MPRLNFENQAASIRRSYHGVMGKRSTDDVLLGLSQFLTRLESNKIIIRYNHVDVTKHEIDILKREISHLEKVMARLK